MAIFQNVLSFFQPSSRRRAPAPPPGTPGGEEVVESLDKALAAVDVLNLPEEVAENFKKDLKGAFKVKAKARPGYEEGRVAPVGVNLIDLVTNPVKTVWETLDESFEVGLPSISVAWETPGSKIWKNGFDSVWLDDNGNQVVPLSLQTATLRWTKATGLRVTRMAAEEGGIKSNPGLIYMMGKGLRAHYQAQGLPIPSFGGKNLDVIVNEAKNAADKIHVELLKVKDPTKAKDLTKEAEDALNSRDIKRWGELQGEIEEHNTNAANIQRDYSKSGRKVPRNVKEAALKEREGVIGTFEYHVSDGKDFANTPEAKYWRYWNYRNQGLLNPFFSGLGPKLINQRPIARDSSKDRLKAFTDRFFHDFLYKIRRDKE